MKQTGVITSISMAGEGRVALSISAYTDTPNGPQHSAHLANLTVAGDTEFRVGQSVTITVEAAGE
jgi:hypothetical protein